MTNPNHSGAFQQALSEGELQDYQERTRSFLNPYQQGRHHQSISQDFESNEMPPPLAMGAGPVPVAVGSTGNGGAMMNVSALGNVGAFGYGGIRVPPGFSFPPPQMSSAAHGSIGAPMPPGIPYPATYVTGPPGAPNDHYPGIVGYGGVLSGGLALQSHYAAMAVASRGIAIPHTLVVPTTWLMHQQHQQQLVDPTTGLPFHLGIGAGLPPSIPRAAYPRGARSHLALGLDHHRAQGAKVPKRAKRPQRAQEEEYDTDYGYDTDNEYDDESETPVPGREGRGRPTKKSKVVIKTKTKKTPPFPLNDDRVTGHKPIPLWNENDEMALTEYQCLLRKQIELFEANEDDIKGSAQGRNTPIRLGQVGIRCIHCSGMSRLSRTRGAVYYSRTVDGVYQVAQNMSKIHFVQTCPKVPKGLRDRLARLQRVNNRASGGKEYWLDHLMAAGVFDSVSCVKFHTGKSGPKLDED